MNPIEYNFNTIIGALSVLKNNEDGVSNGAKHNALKVLKDELNTFFCDLKCIEVVYTYNTDKPMFGLFIKPVWGVDKAVVSKFITRDKDDITFKTYKIEIDSKLLDCLMPAEVCAIMISDINETFTGRSMDAINATMDAILAFRDEELCEQSAIDSLQLLKTCIELTLHNITSCLTRNPDEIVCSEFIRGYKLDHQFNSGIDALYGQDFSSSLKVYNPAITLNWYFMIYKNAKTDRYVASVIKKSIDLEGATLVKKSLVNTLESLTVVSDMDSKYLAAVTEAVVKKKKGLVAQMKRNGLKSLEEDLYEYGMRLRNVETQDDAILLMRQLNSRMSILEDYLAYEDIDEADRKRWTEVYHEYQKIRAELSKKTVYNRKMYGLFVDYNALAQMDRNQQQQVLQSYY